MFSTFWFPSLLLSRKTYSLGKCGIFNWLQQSFNPCSLFVSASTALWGDFLLDRTPDRLQPSPLRSSRRPVWGRQPGPLEESRLSARPCSSARVPASAGQNRASPPGWFSEARRPAAPWRGSSISRPGGPRRPLLPGQEPQPFWGFDPQLWVEKPRLQMPGLRLLGAGGRGPRTRAPTRLPREPALGRNSGSPIWPRPNGDPQTGLAEQSGTNPAPAQRNFSVARAQGESRGRKINSSRAARTLRHPLASHCLWALQGPGPGCGVSLGQGRKDPRGLSPERPVICKRRSRCILDAAPWLY